MSFNVAATLSGWRIEPRSLSNEVLDSKLAEVVASPPISLAQQQKKIA